MNQALFESKLPVVSAVVVPHVLVDPGGCPFFACLEHNAGVNPGRKWCSFALGSVVISSHGISSPFPFSFVACVWGIGAL